MTSREDLWVASPWLIVLCLGFAIVVNIVWRLGARLYYAKFTMRDHEEWCDIVREVLFQLVDAELQRAHLVAKLADLMGRTPVGFDDVARQSFARSLSLTPAALAKAEEAGLFPKGTFEGMGVPKYDAIPPSPQTPAERVGEVVQSVIEPAITWVGTVKVPKRPSDPPPSPEN